MMLDSNELTKLVHPTYPPVWHPWARSRAPGEISFLGNRPNAAGLSSCSVSFFYLLTPLLYCIVLPSTFFFLYIIVHALILWKNVLQYSTHGAYTGLQQLPFRKSEVQVPLNSVCTYRKTFYESTKLFRHFPNFNLIFVNSKIVVV